MLYGTQFFKTSTSLDVLNLYAFEDRLTRSIWLKSDPNSIRHKPDNAELAKYRRHTLDKANARILIKLGHKPVKIPSLSNRSVNPLKRDGFFYVHIFSKETILLNNGLSSPLGVVVQFATKKEANSRVGSFSDMASVTSEVLRRNDPILTYFKLNHLVLDGASVDKPTVLNILSAIANFPMIDPTKNFLCLVCDLDWSNPKIFSFQLKSFRDLFLSSMARYRNNLISAPLNNYSPVALVAIIKGTIYRGTFSRSIKYALNNVTRGG